MCAVRLRRVAEVMDLVALREALEWWRSHRVNFHSDHIGHLEPAIAAARAVLDSEELQWCETHHSSATVQDGKYQCDWLRWALADGRTPALCVVVRVRLLAEEK